MQHAARRRPGVACPATAPPTKEPENTLKARQSGVPRDAAGAERGGGGALPVDGGGRVQMGHGACGCVLCRLAGGGD